MNKALSHKLPALLIAFCLLLICLLTALPTDVLADTTIEEDQQALNDLEAQRKAYMQQLEALQAQINASKNEEKTLLAEKSGEGKTQAVKALLYKYDAGKLSGVKPEDYAALMEEARKL